MGVNTSLISFVSYLIVLISQFDKLTQYNVNGNISKLAASVSFSFYCCFVFAAVWIVDELTQIIYIHNKVQACFLVETFYSKFSPLRAFDEALKGENSEQNVSTKKTCLDFVIPSLHDTILSPSCTVRYTGVIEIEPSLSLGHSQKLCTNTVT